MRVAIIGGGAAGLMAALSVARHGGQAVLLESGERVGRKLLATGNGRCNLTNTNASPAHYHGSGAALVTQVLAAMPPSAVLSLFGALGLLCREESEGRVYPFTGQAASVLDVLRLACERHGVDTRTGTTVRGLAKRDKAFVIDLGNERLPVDRVIVATGGKAAPKTGSDGSGYALLQAFGHTLVPCYPALAQLRCQHPALPALKGVRVPARAALLADGAEIAAEQGELLFADYGLSGIAALGLARAANLALAAGQKVVASLALLPETDDKARRALVDERLALFAGCPASQLFTGLLVRRVGETLLKEAGVSLNAPCQSISASQSQSLAELLDDWRFPVTGTQGFDQAQVTAGGLDAGQFDPATLESRCCPGLYAAGEVLDVDGDCGGYNLHFAWASGFLAGKAAASWEEQR